MTLTLVRKLLRDVRWPLLAVCLLLLAFSALWVKITQRVTAEIAPFFNGVAQISKIDKKLFDEVIFKGPGKVSQAVMGGSGVQFERPTDFLAVELLHPVVIALACIWAVGRAGGAVAGELDRGTMELLLSQPVPRNRLILAHLIVDAVVLPALCLSIVAGTRLGLAAVGPFAVDYSVLDKIKSPIPIPRGPDVLEVDASPQPAAVANYAALMFAISGLTMAISAANRSRWRAIGVAMLVVVGMFVANVVGQLWDAAGVVRPFTLFFYYQPQEIWLGDRWDVDLGEAWAGGRSLFRLPVVGVLLAVGAAGYLVALRIFTRRDLPAPL
jgi:ABC-2 type transport system permease protein